MLTHSIKTYMCFFFLSLSCYFSILLYFPLTESPYVYSLWITVCMQCLYNQLLEQEFPSLCGGETARECVCVCLCVCVHEWLSESARQPGSARSAHKIKCWEMQTVVWYWSNVQEDKMFSLQIHKVYTYRKQFELLPKHKTAFVHKIETGLWLINIHVTILRRVYQNST